jgi:hypothetical protein
MSDRGFGSWRDELATSIPRRRPLRPYVLPLKRRLTLDVTARATRIGRNCGTLHMLRSTMKTISAPASSAFRGSLPHPTIILAAIDRRTRKPGDLRHRRQAAQPALRTSPAANNRRPRSSSFEPTVAESPSRRSCDRPSRNLATERRPYTGTQTPLRCRPGPRADLSRGASCRFRDGQRAHVDNQPCIVPSRPSRQARTRAETRLRGWAYRIRTGESARELSDWNFVATSPEVGASLAAETLRARAAAMRICSSDRDFRVFCSYGSVPCPPIQAGERS